MSEQKKHRSPDERQKLVHRLHRIEGQVRGLTRMLEEDAYCVDLLTQSASVVAAMQAFQRQLLEAHLHSCVVEGIREGRDEVVDELLVVLAKLMK